LVVKANHWSIRFNDQNQGWFPVGFLCFGKSGSSKKAGRFFWKVDSWRVFPVAMETSIEANNPTTKPIPKPYKKERRYFIKLDFSYLCCPLGNFSP
jgi:hypothetical protein